MRLEIAPHTPEWNAIRLQHVGGSEVAALFGASPHLTLLELWLMKHGEIPDDVPESDRLFWGKLLEEPIAQAVAITQKWVRVCSKRPRRLVLGDVP
jgi:predicted phage-related endonuclease